MPVPCNLLPFCSRLAIITVRIDGNTATRGEFAPDFDVLRIHKANQILHDDIDAVLVEIAVIAEAEQIEFERFTLHHAHIRHIRNGHGRKIRLSGNRTQTGKFRTVEFDKIIIVLMFVDKCFQYLWCVILRIFCSLVSKQAECPAFRFRFFLPYYASFFFNAGSSIPFRRNASARSIHVPHTPHGSSPPS